MFPVFKITWTSPESNQTLFRRAFKYRQPNQIWRSQCGQWTSKTSANIFPHCVQVFRKKLRAGKYCFVNSLKGISATSHQFNSKKQKNKKNNEKYNLINISNYILLHFLQFFQFNSYNARNFNDIKDNRNACSILNLNSPQLSPCLCKYKI